MERSADPLLQLEIDEWILDYLVFSATKALLEAYKGSKPGPGNESDKRERASVCLQLVDCKRLLNSNQSCAAKLMPESAFFTTFCAMHPDYDAILDLRFRLRLLKFTAMFTKRLAPEETSSRGPVLQKLRHRRQEQATSYCFGNTEFAALNLPDLTIYLAPLGDKEIKKRHIDQEFTAGHLQPAISLLDTIPLFMAVSAAQISIQEGTITDTWMRLAAGYMAQAVAEQYLVYGSRRRETLQEAFSWGFDPECSAEEGTDEFQINAMFWGTDAAIDGWDRIRDEHVQAVSLKSNMPCALTYGSFAAAHTAGRR